MRRDEAVKVLEHMTITGKDEKEALTLTIETLKRIDEKAIFSDLLARHDIFFDYQEARISIGKFRELLSQAIVNYLEGK